MKYNKIQEFEYSFLLLIFLIIFQQLFLFLQIGITKIFSVDYFILSYINLLGIVVGYFYGFKISMPYSIIFIVCFAFYLIFGRYDISFFHYILFISIPFNSIVASFLLINRLKIYKNEEKLLFLENQNIGTDIKTNMLTDYAFFDTISKYASLSYRYNNFIFTTMIIRIEFINTIKFNLSKENFQNLLSSLSKIIKSNLRFEDYKFFLKNESFVLILPMTKIENTPFLKKRILSKINNLKIYDKNERLINIIVKIGAIEYKKEEHKLYFNLNNIITNLERKSEEDIYAEYKI